MNYHDPHPSDASRHHPRAGPSRRPATISELAERANVPRDESKGFKYYLRLAEKRRREGKEYARSGDMENAFVELTKAATLVLERLPEHPDFNKLLNSTQQHNLGLNGQEILNNLAELKPGIVDRYEKWCQAHPDGVDENTTPNVRTQQLANEEERKTKEEEERQDEVRRREYVRKRAAEEAKRRDEELSGKEAEAKRRLAQSERDTEKAKQMHLEAQRVAEDLKKDMEMKEREDILRRREVELIRRELDIFRRNEEVRKEEETKQKEAARLEEARKAEVNRKLQAEEAEFRKRVEEIRRTREERKRNGDDGARPGSSQNPPVTSPGMSRTPQSNNAPFIRGRSPSLSSPDTGPAPTSSPTIRPTSASSLAVNRSANTSGTPTMRSVSSGTYSKSSSPDPALCPPSLLKKPHEQLESDFRRTPESRQLELAPRPLFPKELQGVFEYHETLWSRLKTLNELSWDDFPWPMAKQPSNPDDMSLSLISAYIQSPLYPHKSRTPRDRIKDHIRRWHPDSFEAKLLRKVVQNEKEKVKLGAGNVARYLSNLLEKENEKENNNHFFGD